MAKRKKGTYQTGRSSRKADRRVKAKSPGKRISKNSTVYYERRKNRSDMPGTMEGLKKTKKRLKLRVKLKRLPKKPGADASVKEMEKYLKRVNSIKKENAERIDLAKKIKNV